MEEFTRWYKDGLRFGCQRCGGCCGGGPGYVWVTNEEIAQMAKALNLTTADFIETFVRLIRGRKMSLHERPNGDCVLLDGKTRRCMVYEARPTQCRTWPFWDSNLERPASWKRASKHCKGCDAQDGKLYTLEEIEELRAKKF